MSPLGRILVMSIGICLISLAAFAQKNLDEAVSELKIYFAQCSTKTGYDPDHVGNLGAHDLHSGERAYADCAYDGINKILKARSRIPEIYDRFIAEHRKLTDKVKSGAITRDERKAAVERMVVSIRNQEEALESPGPGKAAKTTGNANAGASANALEQREDMRRVQDMQRSVNRSIRSLPRF